MECYSIWYWLTLILLSFFFALLICLLSSLLLACVLAIVFAAGGLSVRSKDCIFSCSSRHTMSSSAELSDISGEKRVENMAIYGRGETISSDPPPARAPRSVTTSSGSATQMKNRESRRISVVKQVGIS